MCRLWQQARSLHQPASSYDGSMALLLRLSKFLSPSIEFRTFRLHFFGFSASFFSWASGFYPTESSTSSRCYTPSIGSDDHKTWLFQRSCRAYADVEGIGGVPTRACPA